MTHYETLGVAENATPDEIKTKWKELVKEHHPDKHGGDDTRMKDINEAYDVLKNVDKRNIYDREQSGQFNQNQGDPFEDYVDLSDLFNQDPRRHRQNPPVLIRMVLTLEEVFTGKTQDITIPIDGQQKQVNVSIPAGAPNGIRIRYVGLGSQRFTNVPQGDLIIQVIIEPNPDFEVHGSTLLKKIKIPLFDCVLGTETLIDTIDKKQLKLKIPKGTIPGTLLKMNKQGMPIPGKTRRGDLLVMVNITMPDLTQEQEQKLKDL